jgi:hypothetical protein
VDDAAAALPRLQEGTAAPLAQAVRHQHAGLPAPRLLPGEGGVDRRARHDASIGLAHVAVSAMWRLSGSLRRPPPPVLRDRTRVLRVLDTRLVARDEDVLAIRLAAADGDRLPRWYPGAHIDVLLPGGRVRQYSLCGDPGWDSYRIAVRRPCRGPHRRRRGCSDGTAAAGRMSRRDGGLRVWARPHADRDPRGPCRPRQRRAALRAVRGSSGRRRRSVLREDRVDRAVHHRRRRRDTAVGAAECRRAGAVLVPTGLLRHLPDTGARWHGGAPRHTSHRARAERRDDAGVRVGRAAANA